MTTFMCPHCNYIVPVKVKDDHLKGKMGFYCRHCDKNSDVELIFYDAPLPYTGTTMGHILKQLMPREGE